MRGNFRLSDRAVYTTCSIGISRFPKDGTDGSTLLKHADIAMYSAKAQGGDAFRLFDNAMRPGTDRLLVESELREALERNELELYYQPRISTVSGRPTAVEALVRWNHPTRGLVLPGLFIPIAEETGLIEAIGQWVLRRACHDMRAWLDQGGEALRVSVNLSPLQFGREDLPENVAEVLDEARLPAELLELEITETVAMRSPELAAQHLARLSALGVSLAVDDFGTGHSSLARLKLLNVVCVKIDRSLVEDCTADPHDAALCRAAIALGLALGLEVVAEGVETQEQRQFLAQEHCSTIQGYLVSVPKPAAEAFRLIKRLLEVPRLRTARPPRHRIAPGDLKSAGPSQPGAMRPRTTPLVSRPPAHTLRTPIGRHAARDIDARQLRDVARGVLDLCATLDTTDQRLVPARGMNDFGRRVSRMRRVWASARSRDTIRFKSLEVPSMSVHRVCQSPSKAANCPGARNTVRPCGPKSSSTPAPRTRMSVRSYPVKEENGPALSMVARLKRQSKELVPAGTFRISWVQPPPFFHGMVR